METILVISSVSLWGAVLFNIFLSLALVRRINSLSHPGMPNMPNVDMLEAGTEAPSFEIMTLDGHSVTQTNYKDQARMMVFVSHNCKPCREQMPRLQELFPKAQSAGVELIVINLDDIETTHTYVAETNFTAPIYSTVNGNSLKVDFKVPGTPSYYLIGRDGRIQSGGFLDANWSSMVNAWEDN